MKKFYLFTSFSIFLFAILWNGLVHMVILKEFNESVAYLRRVNQNEFFSLALLMTALIAFLFSCSFLKWKKKDTVREDFAHILFFSSLAGVLVDLNQWILYPIPAKTILLWFLFSILEFTVYQQIANFYYKKWIR
ncbi:hypothetical protein AB3N59_09250 [Leptospira sp. WS92.C1]